jgi:thiamine-phosphate pyrophosphorylase
MPTALYLIAPPDGDADALVRWVRQLLDAARIEALLLPRGAREDDGYFRFIEAVRPWAQGADCAVLIEGTPELARATGVDGLHVDGAEETVRHAVAALKPDLIVGAATTGASRHDAMLKGELGVDYIMFGPLSGAIEPATRELAQWWAEAMEIPGILSDPQASPDAVASEGCEFLALGESLWNAPDPAAAIAAIAGRLDRE